MSTNYIKLILICLGFKNEMFTRCPRIANGIFINWKPSSGPLYYEGKRLICTVLFLHLIFFSFFFSSFLMFPFSLSHFFLQTLSLTHFMKHFYKLELKYLCSNNIIYGTQTKSCEQTVYYQVINVRF